MRAPRLTQGLQKLLSGIRGSKCMFEAGETVDGKWEVLGPCSNAGGMGTLVFVRHTGTTGPQFVLKFCKLAGDELLARFRREVRLMQQFDGNSYVMPVIDANLDHDPPYFVMPWYRHGDLASRSAEIRDNFPALEFVFNRMIDCVAQLHAKDILHRDIKPQNFVVGDDTFVLSDLGLCCEQESETGLTRSSVFWGTQGYLPPEFLSGGFKAADAAGDVFMLGKTFYVMLTGRDPTYLVADDIPPPLFPVIERCCAIAKGSRYQALSSLRQSLTTSFDVMLGRAVGTARAYGIQRAIMDRLKAQGQYETAEVTRFVEELVVMETLDKIQMCLEMPAEMFALVSQAAVTHVGQFLAVYRQMVEEATYGWSFAEVIANNMKVLFDAAAVSATDKAEALRIAIIGAERQNRFAAMDTCTVMITSVTDPELGQRVHDVMLQQAQTFMENIEPTSCRAPAIRAAIIMLKEQTAARVAAQPASPDFPF